MSRAAAILTVELRQALRDPLGLALTLLTAPLLVLFCWLLVGQGGSPSYTVAVHDADAARASLSPMGQTLGRGLVVALAELQDGGGGRLFKIKAVSHRAEVERALRAGEADVGLLIPVGFSRALGVEGEQRAARVSLLGATRPVALIRAVVEAYGHRARGSAPVIEVRLPGAGELASSAFQLYVPGLLVFTVIMLIFSASMSVARQVEAGTLARLRLAPVSTLSLLLGASAAQLVLGVGALALTFATAALLGFRSQGSLLLALLVACVAGLASVGIGMVVASLSRTTTRAFLLGSVAMFLLVLFSGVVFPRPRLSLFALGGRTIDLFDALPTTHLGVALNRVLNLGASAAEISYELLWLVAISLASFVVGGLLFARSARPATGGPEGPL